MTILLIDDDPDEILLFKEAIGETGLNIELISGSGASCVDLLRDVKPDVIFLDINMPRVNGKECLKAIKSNSLLKNTPIIIYSTGLSPSDKEFFDDYNVSYRKKPAVFQELVSFVRETVAEITS